MAKNEEIVNTVSRIAAGTRITGEIYSENDMRIDGVFDGKLFSKGRIVIGESAVVSGSVACSNMDMWGTMKGDLYVKDTLALKSGSSVTGDINIRRFVVELGVSLNGTCRMITEEDFDKVASVASQD